MAAGRGGKYDQILIPLEQETRAVEKPCRWKSSSTARSAPRKPGSSILQLVAPKFDLPLENITWRVYLNDKWQLQKWSGSLQLQQDETVKVRPAR